MDNLDKEFNRMASIASSSSKKCPEGGEHEEEGNAPRYPIDGTDICCYKCGTWMRNIPWKEGY